MKRPARRKVIVALSLVSLVIPSLCAGCNRHSANGKSTVATPTPEVQFSRILEAFRRSVEDQPVGFVVNDGGNRSTLFGTNKVTSKLIPPVSSDDHYKAVITVSSESHYSLRRTKNPAEEAEREQNAKNQSSSALTNPKDKKGIGILEPDLAGKASSDPPKTVPKSTQPDEEVVTRRPDGAVRNYELSHDGDRWEAVTTLDQKTEKAIKFAFDEAIAGQ